MNDWIIRDFNRMMNHGHIDGDKMHLWRWRLTTKKAFSQNALNEIFCCQWHAVGSLWNHISSICQDWLEHWIQSSSCYKTFSRISFSYHIGFSTLIKHSVEKSEFQYCKLELFQARGKERKIDWEIIQQSTQNTLLNIEPIHMADT